ncbi:MAG: TetM/TetW/TetO/TetS family tetracycline resistance ribosomal protection protein [Roseiflexaceae bacterium]
MHCLHIGILAHVDAGKTSLTERLLFSAGVIDRIGSVDAGTTQTDTLALERQRGITIKSAVVSFLIDDLSVNLIDTPGHPDFIAEVERVLSVLDGAVLVVSAVEGVQPQTRVLMRTLQRLRIPTLIFVNKIDRGGADVGRVLRAISTRLTPAIIPMGTASGQGTRDASYQPYHPDDPHFMSNLVDLLAERDDALLAAYLQHGASLPPSCLHSALAAQTAQALVHPVFCGSAITGAGVEALIAGIKQLLPAAQGDSDAPVSGSVFKIERGPSNEKIAYARLVSGTVRVRDRLHFGRGNEGRVTALAVFERGTAVRRNSAVAGQIAKLWGLGDIQIGDPIGVPQAGAAQHYFAPPTLETLVVPRRAADRSALHQALSQLAEQDPLINLRRDDLRQELFVSLYGEVQKEVIEATLLSDYGIAVEFCETTTICIERPVGTGESLDWIGKADNPFVATVGLRVEPAPPGSGVVFRLEAEPMTVPIYVYKSVELFREAMETTVRETLRQGLCGWQVEDCLVTMNHSGYMSPVSTSGDFRKLTPLPLMDALKQAGTVVCAPMHHFRLEIPTDTYGTVAGALARLAAVPQSQEVHGTAYVLEGVIPAGQVHALQQQVPTLTRGEGVLETAFDHYHPVSGTPPTRARTDNNPLNRKEYLLSVLRRR